MAPKSPAKKSAAAKKAAAPKVKRAPSPYIVYCTENRDKIKAANPSATFGELGKLLGAAWGKMTDAQKKVERFIPTLQFTSTIEPPNAIPPSPHRLTSTSPRRRRASSNKCLLGTTIPFFGFLLTFCVGDLWMLIKY